jgi:leucyl-tRNA synthetase
MKIESQHDREKLKEAKKIIYKSGFYTGVMSENTGEYAGMKVEEAKDRVKEALIASGDADVMYELSGDVVCRCLTPCIVKVVSNQWFIAYGNRDWKKKAHEALDEMTLYPEGVRKQFDYVLDWLNDWACTREFGLGTKLPWDESWVIESLSDSTIYMSYYTISKYLEHEKVIQPEKLDDSFFDYIFLNEGDVKSLSQKTGITELKLGEIKAEFEYWYPYDIRVSGKDLVQNHLSFCLFNHVGIFPKKFWPQGFGLNGWILVSGAKMSKSAGNFYILRDMMGKYGADATRLTLTYSGEGIDDPNFSMDFAKGAGSRLTAWRDFAINSYNKGRDETIGIDGWFRSIMASSIKETKGQMNEMNFRTALKVGYFDLQRHLRWYQRRCLGNPNKDLVNSFIEDQTKILAPVIPHICEEIWEKLGKEGFITQAQYPQAEEDNIDPKIELSEEFLTNTISDVNEILKVTGIKPKKIVLYTPSQWKYEMHDIALDLASNKKLQINDLMKTAMTNDNIKSHSKEASQFAKKLVENLKNRGADELDRLSIEIDEKGYLTEALEFLKSEYKCEVEVQSADEKDLYDPQNKAKFAQPQRTAIYVE